MSGRKLFVFFVITSIVVSGSLGNQTKLRNVDDPSVDPASYSQQWVSIIADADSSFRANVFDVFAKRFQEIVNAGSVNMSSACSSSLETYFADPFSQEWSLRMWDSNGHMPSGLLSASFFEPGNYDQCMSIKGGLQSTTPNGKYCIMNIQMPRPITMVNFTLVNDEHSSKYAHMDSMVNYLTKWDLYSPVSNGLCLPSTCTQTELNNVVPKGN